MEICGGRHAGRGGRCRRVVLCVRRTMLGEEIERSWEKMKSLPRVPLHDVARHTLRSEVWIQAGPAPHGANAILREGMEQVS